MIHAGAGVMTAPVPPLTGVEMVKVTFARPFRFSPDGFTVVDYATGSAEVSKRCAEVAAAAGALEAAKEPKKPAKTKATK